MLFNTAESEMVITGYHAKSTKYTSIGVTVGEAAVCGSSITGCQPIGLCAPLPAETPILA